LNFTDIQPGKVWGDGVFQVGSESIGIYIHIPCAKVTGRIAVNGDTLAVTGRAYMDHTFQTDFGPEMVSAGYRYVSPGAPLQAGYFLQPLPKFGSQPIGYGLRQDSGGVELLKPASLKVLSASKALGLAIPTRLEVQFQDGSKCTLNRGETDRYRVSLLSEFNWLEKRAIRGVMGGEVKTFKGMGTLNGSRPVGYDFFLVDD
jgi:hypothetical protein